MSEKRAICHYQCKDGKRYQFKFDLNGKRVMNSNNWTSTPIYYEAIKHIDTRKNNPNSKMNQHGGFDYIRSIELDNSITVNPYVLGGFLS